MAEETKIEWTDATFNPWWGCTKIAPACDNCYAAALDKRSGGNHWGTNDRRRTSVQNWNQPRRWQKKAAEFFAAHGRRRRVFCASMADVFDNQVPTEWRDDLWALILECPDLDWLLLTKRPQNIAKMLPFFWDDVKGHVWLGTTVEDQKHADLNIPHLLQHDAAVRFVSCEPLLGNIDFGAIPLLPNRSGTKINLGNLTPNMWAKIEADTSNLNPTYNALGGDLEAVIGFPPYRLINWVIAGGESGPHARPSSPQWFRSLRDQCEVAGTPFLFKQHGEWAEFFDAGQPVGKPLAMISVDGTVQNDPTLGDLKAQIEIMNLGLDGRDLIVHVGKKAAGRLLDKVEHNGYPIPISEEAGQ